MLGNKRKERVEGGYDQIILHTTVTFSKDKWKYLKIILEPLVCVSPVSFFWRRSGHYGRL